MSLYNAMHGYEPTARFVFAVLELLPNDVARFRDAYITYKDETKAEAVMVIMSRTGEGAWTDRYNDHLEKHPLFLDVSDDDFDHTFRMHRFRLPEPLQTHAGMAYLNEHGAPLSLQEKAEQIVGPDRTRRQKEALDRVADQMKKVIEGE